jgi:putative DNA primase/helicase
VVSSLASLPSVENPSPICVNPCPSVVETSGSVPSPLSPVKAEPEIGVDSSSFVVSSLASLPSVENPAAVDSDLFENRHSKIENETDSVPSLLSPVKSEPEIGVDSSSPVVSSSSSLPSAENPLPICVNLCPSVVENSSPAGLLLNDLVSILRRFVILSPHAAETLALWILHTYAYQLRDVSTYIGIESPGKGCGKTTLLRVLGKLVRKPVSTANVSPSALFRVIEELQPTLLIDEADTFLRNNDELRGILNAGYTPDTAFVLRAVSESSSSSSSCSSSTDSDVLFASANNPSIHQSITPPPGSGFRQFSTWCPKAIAMIGRLPETLGDRCIIIRMQKKSRDQKCERIRDLNVGDLPARCEQFVKANADTIAKARPAIPAQLGDRAADIWEPLLVLADIAGTEWSGLARAAATLTTQKAQEVNPTAALLADVKSVFEARQADRLWSRTVATALNEMSDRPWRELTYGARLTEAWLSRFLRTFGIKNRNISIDGIQARGYYLEDCLQAIVRSHAQPNQQDSSFTG